MRNEKVSFLIFFFLSFFFFIYPIKRGISILFVDYFYHPVILLKKNIEKLKKWEKEKEIILKEFKRKENKVFSTTYKIYSEGFPPIFLYIYKPENFDSESKFVFQDENLAGIIKEKGKDKILVETIFSPYFKIDVIDKRSNVLGVLKSKGDFLLDLHYVPYWADLKEGDTLVTAGIWEDVPAGIKIGVVEKILKEEGEIFMKINVRPFFDPSKISIFLLK